MTSYADKGIEWFLMLNDYSSWPLLSEKNARIVLLAIIISRMDRPLFFENLDTFLQKLFTQFLQVQNILVVGHSCCGGIRALMSMPDEADSSSFIRSWVVTGKNAKLSTKASASNLSFDLQCTHCEKVQCLFLKRYSLLFLTIICFKSSLL